MEKKSKNSTWLKDAEYRIANRKWLGYSSNIARRILAAIRDKQEIDQSVNQEYLAKEIGVSAQYISKVIQGSENLSLKTIAKISDALGIELISFPEYRYSKNNTNNKSVNTEIDNYRPFTLSKNPVVIGDNLLTASITTAEKTSDQFSTVRDNKAA